MLNVRVRKSRDQRRARDLSESVPMANLKPSTALCLTCAGLENVYWAADALDSKFESCGFDESMSGLRRFSETPSWHVTLTGDPCDWFNNHLNHTMILFYPNVAKQKTCLLMLKPRSLPSEPAILSTYIDSTCIITLYWWQFPHNGAAEKGHETLQLVVHISRARISREDASRSLSSNPIFKNSKLLFSILLPNPIELMKADKI